MLTSFLASSWYSPAGAVFAVVLVALGERQKEEVYFLISSLIRRIDRPCESYSPPTIHFFVVAPNPIIVPPHSTLHSSVSFTSYPRWLMAYPFSHFSFFLFFLIPLIVSNGIWIYYNYFVPLLALVTHLINSNMLQLIWLRQWDK